MKNPASKLIRIRLELEDYDFEIQHIAGKDNVIADALSRISIEDLKEIYHDNAILVTTRAQLKRLNRSKDKSGGEKAKNEFISEPKVIEELSRKYVSKIPRIKSALNNDTTVVGAYKNHRKIFEIEFVHKNVNEKFPLEQILSSLEKMATSHKHSTLQWPMNDVFFTAYNLNEFKDISEKTLNNLRISLISPVEKIDDANKKIEIMTKFHNDPVVGGHMGQKKLYEKIRSQFYWKNMSREIAKFVNNCDKCKVNKPKTKTKAPMVLTKTPQKPFDLLIVDTVGPLPKSNYGNSYILTIICDLSKYLITCPIPDKSAKTVAKAMVDNCILIFGMFKELRSDCGTEYKNAILAELCDLLNINQVFSTPYRHETVGSIERNHRFFNEYIRAYVNNLSDWEDYLRYFSFCYNISTHSSFDHKFSPFELVFSKKATLPTYLHDTDIDPIYNFDNFVKEAKFRLHNAHNLAQKLLEKSKLRSKKYYDKSTHDINVKVGDQVYVIKEPYDKYKSPYVGPFTVKNVIEPNIEILDISTQKTKIVHKNKIFIQS